MALRLSINLGFVTNSSSMIHHFPREVLQDPVVRAFIEAFEVTKGFVGDDLWDRSACSTFAVTPEQKEEVRKKLASINEPDREWVTRVPTIEGDDSVVLIYGDEYSGLASSLSGLMGAAAQRLGLKRGRGEEYN